MKDEKNIVRQPLGELLRREISTDFLHKDLRIPEFLKKEIPGGILDKEIRFRRKRNEGSPEEAVEQLSCTMCGRETPATVSTCLHCGAHHDIVLEEEPESALLYSEEEQPGSLIDISDELL